MEMLNRTVHCTKLVRIGFGVLTEGIWVRGDI